MRVTSEFWTSAYRRRQTSLGNFATIVKKGALEAGAIFILVNRLDSRFDLYGPAPQYTFSVGNEDIERKFECLLSSALQSEVDKKFENEARMDPDFWVVEIEDRDGQHLLDVVAQD
ncbi:MAG: DUF1491 family protein [Stappiaceae bacterium]